MLKTDGVIWHISMSVDGYVVDASGSLNFMIDYTLPSPHHLDQRQRDQGRSIAELMK